MTIVPKAEAIAALRKAVLDGPGVTDRAAQGAVFSGDVSDEPYAGYMTKVRDSSYRVRTAYFTTMTEAGLSEEGTLAAVAVGRVAVEFVQHSALHSEMRGSIADEQTARDQWRSHAAMSATTAGSTCCGDE